MAKRDKRGTGRRSQQSYASLGDHKQDGKVLSPPFANLPGAKLTSWIDDRLPEMLWSALIVAHFDRPNALSVFRYVANIFHNRNLADKTKVDVAHSRLAELSYSLSNEVVELLCSTAESRFALRPLMLLDDLPSKEVWSQHLESASPGEDWDRLRLAVAQVLFHQSQEATDCRWARILPKVVAGQFHLGTQERFKEIFGYPDVGDQRAVRPSIRAMEGSFSILDNDNESSSTWAKSFWKQVWRDTPCMPHAVSIESSFSTGTTLKRVEEVGYQLVKHAESTTTGTSIDPKHDTTFGIAAYGLGILKEMLRIGASTSITARLSLRALFEASVTLSYLAQKDRVETWQGYRSYGIGQAKLAFLKLDDEQLHGVGFVDNETLSAIANEDKSLDFVTINYGHWDATNLRKMSEEAGLKDDYDRYYSWSSGYVHSQWGAIRSVNFDLCLNALHKGHRVLRTEPAPLNDVISDGCELVDKILKLVDRLYPVFLPRTTLSAQDDSS